MTALDEWSVDLTEAVRRERAAYVAGRADAEADMAAHWAALARSIQRSADRIRGPIPEPTPRPQPDDEIWFTAAELAARDGAA